MAQIATHDGIVTEVSNQQVKVQIQSLSACSSCKAHSKCGFSEQSDKTIEVATNDWQDYHIGDSVTVGINQGLGLQAVLLAYLLPALLLIGSLMAISIFCNSELLAALLPLAVIVCYYLTLYHFRNRLQRKFSFTLTKR